MAIASFLNSTRRRLLCTTMCCLLVSATDALAAFDPDAGAEDTAPISYTNTVRKRTAPAPMMMISRSTAPLYPAADRGLVPAVDAVAMPKPLYPTRAMAPASVMQPANANTPTATASVPVEAVSAQPMTPLPDTSIASTSSFPPVSPEVKARADSMLAAPSESTQMAGYIAPPPPLPDMAPVHGNIVQPSTPNASGTPPLEMVADEGAPVDIVEPNLGNSARSSTGNQMNTVATIPPPPPVLGNASTIPSPAPQSMAASSSLSPETKAILGKLPSRIGTAPAVAASRSTVSRVSPEVSQLIPNLEKEAEYEQVGLKISVSRESLDAPYELNRAYDALIAGDSTTAVEIYKNVIADQPQNQEALFGLAATYHRAGELVKARSLYGALLRINPNHREGLNNFLVLVSDEAPEEALFELQRLAERNPEFSPIRAQMALVLEKLGQHDLAREQILKAIRMSPENLVYKYNLAVMMDRQGRHADASALYGLLVDAALRGESIPAPLEDIQKRLNYINTASIDTRGS